jgi:hypothetical protein
VKGTVFHYCRKQVSEEAAFSAPGSPPADVEDLVDYFLISTSVSELNLLLENMLSFVGTADERRREAFGKEEAG